MTKDHLRLVEPAFSPSPVATVHPLRPIAESFLFSETDGALVCIHNGRQVSVSDAAIAMAALCERVRLYLRDAPVAVVHAQCVQPLRLVASEDDPKDGA